MPETSRPEADVGEFSRWGVRGEVGSFFVKSRNIFFGKITGLGEHRIKTGGRMTLGKNQIISFIHPTKTDECEDLGAGKRRTDMPGISSIVHSQEAKLNRAALSL